MISDKNKLIQVKVSKLSYEYLKKYSSMFGISISRFCEMAINDKICKIGEIRGDIDKYGYPKESC